MEPHKLAVLFSWKGDISFSKHARLKTAVDCLAQLPVRGGVHFPSPWVGLACDYFDPERMAEGMPGKFGASSLGGLTTFPHGLLEPCAATWEVQLPPRETTWGERELHTPFQLWPPVCQACCGTSCDSALAEHPWGNPSMPHGAEESPSWALHKFPIHTITKECKLVTSSH